MKLSRLYIYFLAAFLFAVLVNEINLYRIRTENPSNEQVNTKSLIHDATIYSIDDVFYLSQVKNFLSGQGFTSDTENDYYLVRRTPGYPIFYGIHYWLFGEENAHFVIRYTQSLLFALSVILLGLGVFNFTGNRILSEITIIGYALCLPAIGYLYYTITEAIHPAFVIFTFFAFSKAWVSESRRWYLAAGVLCCIATLIRPSNGVLLPAMGLSLLVHKFAPVGYRSVKKLIRNGGMILAGFLLVITPWMVRNFIVTGGEVILFEKFYYEDSMGFGKEYRYFVKWRKGWENPHTVSFALQLIQDLEKGGSGEKMISEYVNALPEYALAGYSQQDVKNVLLDFRDCYRQKIESGRGVRYIKPGERLPVCEEKVKEQFQLLINKYKQERPVRYYLISPMERLNQLVLQSFSNMYGPLNPDNGQFSFFQKAVKSYMYIMNLLLFAGLAGFFLVKIPRVFFLFFILFTLFFMVVVHNHVETRYILGIYPLMYPGLSVLIYKLLLKIRAIKG